MIEITSILAAIISGAVAIVVAVINTNTNMQKILSALDKHNEVQDVRIEQLIQRVDKHNNLVERTYALEKEVEILKSVNQRKE